MKEMKDLREKMFIAEAEERYDDAFHYDCESEWKADDVCKIFYKIRDIEDNIKALNKKFKSSIKEPPFL